MVAGCIQNRLFVTDNVMQDITLQISYNVLIPGLHSLVSVDISIENSCVGVDNIGMSIKKVNTGNH